MLVVANTCSKPFWWPDEGKQQTQAVQNPSPVAGGLERRLETERVPVHQNMLQHSVVTFVAFVCLCDPSISFRRTWPNDMIRCPPLRGAHNCQGCQRSHRPCSPCTHFSTCVYLSHKVGQCPTDQTAGVFMMSQTRGKSGVCWSLARWAGS